MKNELQRETAQKINDLHKTAIASAMTTIENALKAGELLKDIKDGLKHGQFTVWVEKNLDFDIRTAQRYMRAYERRDLLKNDSVSYLKQLTEPELKKEEPELKFELPFTPPVYPRIYFSTFHIGTEIHIVEVGESPEHSGFYWTLRCVKDANERIEEHFRESYIEGHKIGIRKDFAGFLLIEWYGLDFIKNIQWEVNDIGKSCIYDMPLYGRTDLSREYFVDKKKYSEQKK